MTICSKWACFNIQSCLCKLKIECFTAIRYLYSHDTRYGLPLWQYITLTSIAWSIRCNSAILQAILTLITWDRVWTATRTISTRPTLATCKARKIFTHQLYTFKPFLPWAHFKMSTQLLMFHQVIADVALFHYSNNAPTPYPLVETQNYLSS